jgi:hypothetical protein
VIRALLYAECGPNHCGLTIAILISLILGNTMPGQDLVLSEFLASNTVGLLHDNDGDTSDWIEIFNPSPETVSMKGWSLTDDPDDLTKWSFGDASIEGQSFLLVFASSKDRSEAASPLHTNFSLDRDGEFLALVRPDGTIASSFTPKFPQQKTNVSYGRQMEITVRALVTGDGTASFRAAVDGAVDPLWQQPDFDDSPWDKVTLGIGYDLTEPPEVERQLGDVSQSGDLVIGTSTSSPRGEEVDKAIDDQASTKYLNFDKLNAGLTVTLSRGASPVTGLRFTSANDVPDRDPTRFVLSGSTDGSVFTEVASGPIPDFSRRFQTVEVAFNNDLAFSQYRLLFPSVRNANGAAAMQIAEVEFLALSEVIASEEITLEGAAIEPTSFNSPPNEEVDKAIDRNSATKYLNFDKLNAGFTVTPMSSANVVTGLRLTSANDAPQRDPTSYTLEGSNDGQNFTAITAGQLPDFPSRFATLDVHFKNETPYIDYRLLFPTIRSTSAVAMQIAEVTFLGRVTAPVIFKDLIATDVSAELHELTGTAYLRIPFTLDADAMLEAPALNVWYDHGFIAYLNGAEIARDNVPSVAARSREAAGRAERFDLSRFAHLFLPGENVLALQGLNEAIDSPDFLLRAELLDTRVTLGEHAYFESPTPEAPNTGGSLGIVDDLSTSVERGFFEEPFLLTLTTETTDPIIHYTINGSTPTRENGLLYASPITINRTTVLRAAAFREDWLSSSVLTHTYLFADDVIDQTRQTALAAGLPARWNSQDADYGLDSRVPLKAEEMTTLPSISLVIEPDEMFGSRGIYANPNSRGSNWERAISFEWIDPTNNQSFRENAGIRIQGGAFRRFDLTLKKSFRLIFRERYGARRLDRSIFGSDAAPEADSIVLRANGNDGWKWGGSSALYIRDAFAMESMRAMGNVASHSTFAHLYINGHYWGLYNPAERPDAAFSSIYHGGARSSWDALNQDSVPDGNNEAWNRFLSLLNAGASHNAAYQRLQGNHPDGTRNPEFEVLLDVDNLIDYMLLNFYLGNADWPGRNHWYGINRDGEQGFQFYPWDSETAIGLGSGVTANRTSVSDSVARPFAALRNNAEFRVRFGDRVHQHFFKGGPFYVDPSAPAWNPQTPNNNQPARRFAALAKQVEAAIAPESARWGDQLGSQPFTRSNHWRTERNDLLNNYFPRRSAIVIDQLRAARLYPEVDAPVFSRHEGNVAPGFSLTMSSKTGTIHYTSDGTDPRSSPTAQTYTGPIILNDLTTLRARTSQNSKWSALNKATFIVGTPSLVISELDYHPAPPNELEIAAGFDDRDDFEFIELFNPGTHSIDLTGLHISNGVTFDFRDSNISRLPANGRLLLVSNAAAFAQRYEAIAAIAGEYGGQLANSGERLTVTTADAANLVDFTYNDRLPWPTTADGSGSALAFRNRSEDPTRAESWSAEAITPGAPPVSRAAREIEVTHEGNDIVISFLTDAQVAYTVETSIALSDGWQVERRLAPVATTTIEKVRIPLMPQEQQTRFFRVRTEE